MTNPWELYDLLQDSANAPAVVEEVLMGAVWTLCRVGEGRVGDDGSESAPRLGLAMSLGSSVRTLSWAGTLVGRSVNELQAWVRAWDEHKATVGMAAINAAIGCPPELARQTVALRNGGPANLAVFEHFLPRLHGQRVVVVGRYPGLDRYANMLDLTVLERNVDAGDFPDPAAEYLLPEAEWVFLTGTSITNKTFPRLAELSHNANLVLMGPTVPWLPALREFGVDYLAGTLVSDPWAVRSTVAEGGGTRIFENGVDYHLLDLGQSEMACVRSVISDLVVYRERLMDEMEAWYAGPWRGTFPRAEELMNVDRELAELDVQFKRLWDARHDRAAVA